MPINNRTPSEFIENCNYLRLEYVLLLILCYGYERRVTNYYMLHSFEIHSLTVMDKSTAFIVGAVPR